MGASLDFLPRDRDIPLRSGVSPIYVRLSHDAIGRQFQHPGDLESLTGSAEDRDAVGSQWGWRIQARVVTTAPSCPAHLGVFLGTTNVLVCHPRDVDDCRKLLV